MATIYTHQSNNVLKTWLLVGVFLAIVLGIGAFLSYYYNNPGILTIAIIFSVVMNITSFWFSDKIALSMARAVPADPSRYAELHRIIDNLAITAGLPKPRVYIIPDAAPNAFATGRNAKHAAVAVTEGLLQVLDRVADLQRAQAAQAFAVAGFRHVGLVEHLQAHRVNVVDERGKTDQRLLAFADLHEFGQFAKVPRGVAL